MSATGNLARGVRRPRTPEETRRSRRFRIPFFAFCLTYFLIAIYGGLHRLGWRLPDAAGAADLHGPLMIGGFFGTMIGLERAVALGDRWTFMAPSMSCLAALLLLAGAPLPVAALLLIASAALLTWASLAVWLDDRQLFAAVLAMGAGCLTIGNSVWLAKSDVPSAAPWWILFLVLTIAAERLGISRSPAIGRAGGAALGLCCSLLVAGAVSGLFTKPGALMLGSGFFALSAWLFRHDYALRHFRRAPHLRFFAVCMSVGYLWMALAGAALLVAPPMTAPFGYDLVLHAIFIGFVLSMAIGHSIMIVPVNSGAVAPYHPAMYLGLGLLHASVLARVCADALAWTPGRMASGPLTVLGLFAFGVVLAWQMKWVVMRKNP